MKIVSWNVNGLKSVISKGFETAIKKMNPDIICIQETKVSKEIENFKLQGYYEYYNLTNTGGFSGVAIFSKKEAEKVIKGIYLDESENIDLESRVITLEYDEFYVVCVYVPNTQLGVRRLNYRIDFDEMLYQYIEKLNNIKNVIICGDFNLCYQKIDIGDIKKHNRLNNFTDEERAGFNELLDLGFIDTFRFKNPKLRKYTFWTSSANRKETTEGWRLDYILVSDFMKKDVKEARILDEIEGSDHCPIELVIESEDWTNE